MLDLPDEPLDAAADREKLRQILDAPARQRGQVLAGRRHGHGRGAPPERTRSRCASTTRAIGIPQAEQERIFRKFYRGGQPGGSAEPGSGSSSRSGLVAAMGGRIWVDSAEGGGSSFAFELPLARGDVGARAQPTRRV